MATLTFTLEGGVNVAVTITELEGGALQFDLAVLDETGSIGDLNGLFFDLTDASLLDGLVFSGTDVTGTAVKEDGVTKVDGYMNINGDVVNEYGKFDAGVQFGTAGIAGDDIRETSFVLSHESVDLSLDMLSQMDFAVRLTSVGEEDGSRDDSLKIGGTAPEVVEEPEGPVAVAGPDSMTVTTNETFSEFGLSDPLDDFVFSVLENDTVDGTPTTGTVVAANGQVFEDFVIVSGSNGGQMQFNSDGTVDFSANGDFDHLTGDQTDTTEFTYTTSDGATGTLSVEVFVATDGGPIGEFGPF
ncbi:hypothetical protein ABMC89_12815 [Sulfitobacter sp. HNIBRBA3233]|uniref:hypothetical protein n=1 Tax=Sulfitobacter marinivivus TaxID=3158558 RepID=UPI0032E0473A